MYLYIFEKVEVILLGKPMVVQKTSDLPKLSVFYWRKYSKDSGGNRGF